MLLSACHRPTPDAYFGGQPSAAPLELGRNAAGETCTLQGDVIFCGDWDKPSAHVRQGEATDQLARLAVDSPWRAAINTRYACDAPVTTSVLGGAPAYVLNCVRREGGWPQLALLAAVDGHVYYADGILPTLPVMERAIGVLSGRRSAAAAASDADALFAARLAAQAFGSGSIGQYEHLMQAATRANLAERFAAAEQADRAALTLQQKAIGQDNPNTVAALTALALQISDQGRFAEADALFDKAGRLAPLAADRVALPRLLHDRALHEVNQGHDEAALGALRAAEAAYVALLPADVLLPRPRASLGFVYANRGSGYLSRQLDVDSTVIDPAMRNALIGVVETRRYQAIVLRQLGRLADSDAAMQAARTLATDHAMRQPILTARIYRTGAANAGAAGQTADAVSGLQHASVAFGAALPETRPVALTELLAADQFIRAGDTEAARRACDTASGLLRRLRAGVPARLLEPCLAAYFAQAGHDPARAQADLAAMFEAAQLAQGGVTSRQIALASARLAETARDPMVGAAIRRRQDADAKLSDLIRTRALAEAARQGDVLAPPVDAAELDKRIKAAQADQEDADAALQAASPQYGQLVQQVAGASEVLAALAPDESFAAIILGQSGGWVFVLHDGRIAVAPTGLTEAVAAALVQRVRRGIEPTGTDLPRFDTAAAAQLYAETLGRLDPALAGTKSLIVAPAGSLLSIPLGVLLTGPVAADPLGTAPFLLRRFAIAHVPSAANFISLRKVATTSRASRPWFGFGDFVPSTLAQARASFPGAACADSARLFAGLPRLPASARELAAARALLGGTPADELLGAGFTAAAVQRPPLNDYRILHFSAHALLPAELRCVDEPAIVTSDPPGATDVAGALLTASEVTGLNLDADAVILSACNTGGPGGSGTGGESLSGLARSFFYAGARALLVTHWSVNDQAAAFLIADTLNRLRKGEGAGLADALRGAELGLLDDAGKRSPAGFAHPFFWAPFALIGEGRGRSLSAASMASGRVAGL